MLDVNGQDIRTLIKEQQAKEESMEHEDDDTSEEEELDLNIGDYVELGGGVQVCASLCYDVRQLVIDRDHFVF